MSLRLTREDEGRLAALAATLGRSRQDVLRALLRAEYPRVLSAIHLVRALERAYGPRATLTIRLDPAREPDGRLPDGRSHIGAYAIRADVEAAEQTGDHDAPQTPDAPLTQWVQVLHRRGGDIVTIEIADRVDDTVRIYVCAIPCRVSATYSVRIADLDPGLAVPPSTTT
jgi:hypothetical protein